MPWIIGIDEAGYGPNLGPLVMTSVACRVPKELAGRDLWEVLKTVVRRQSDPEDGRVVVDDSKLVYSPVIGLGGLETAVWSILANGQSKVLLTLNEYLAWASPASTEELEKEPWFTGETRVPFAQKRSAYRKTIQLVSRTFEDCGIRFGPVHSVVVCAPRFNQLLNYWNSKGAILGHGLSELLLRRLTPAAQDWLGKDEPIDFVIDKHGGRNYYFAILQQAMREKMVIALEEGLNRSVYSVYWKGIRFTFQPRADAEHFCVALASMASKYLRELLMVEFNQFWRTHLPDLAPTAGYPGDSRRFYRAIKPVAKRLGIPREALWRRR